MLQVRVAIASQLNVMAKHVPPADAARLLRRPLSALLRDTSPLVREALLTGLADTLQVRAGAPNRPGAPPGMVQSLWKTFLTRLSEQHAILVQCDAAREHALGMGPATHTRGLKRLHTFPSALTGTFAAHALQALASVDDLHREGLASDIHQGLLALQGNIADNWRCQQHMAAALPHLPNLLGPDVLAEAWAPYAFGLLLNGEKHGP